MGGSAFSSGENPLYTPRMPREVYEVVKTRCHKILQDLYLSVASPIDGPGKRDFGDIDILVASPKNHSSSRDEALAIISRALDVKREIISGGNDVAANLAIPWPASDSSDLTHLSLVNPDANTSEGSHDRYIQVDIRVCETTEQFHWMLFKYGHGDLWNLLGSMIRHYGLTVDDKAMWLRVPEIEESNKKRARIFLCSEPCEVLRFLGLPMEEYWERPFQCLEEMFEYAARCRLMYVSPVQAEPDAKKLKSNDRRRMSSRPAFKIWVEEFLPQCRERGRFADKKTTREDVTKEAFVWFNVEEEFVARRDEFLLERQKEHIWNHSIKGSIPLPEKATPREILYRSCLVKALKRIIIEDDESYGVLPEESLKDDKGHFIMENVVDFITRHQEGVGNAAMARHKAAYAEPLRVKEGQPKKGSGEA